MNIKDIPQKPCESKCGAVAIFDNDYCSACINEGTNKKDYFKFIYECICHEYVNIYRISASGKDHTFCTLKSKGFDNGIEL